MAENIVAWNVPNWITVVLMVAVLYFIITMIHRIIQQKNSTQGA